MASVIIGTINFITEHGESCKKLVIARYAYRTDSQRSTVWTHAAPGVPMEKPAQLIDICFSEHTSACCVSFRPRVCVRATNAGLQTLKPPSWHQN